MLGQHSGDCPCAAQENLYSAARRYVDDGILQEGFPMPYY